MAIVEGPDVRRVSTSYGEVRVRDTGGDGAPVLLVHSLLFDPDLYVRLVPLLTSAGLRCVVPELPLGAHAVPLRADADLSPSGLTSLIVEALDGIGVDRVDAVGVDTGGALVQLLMADHRDRIDRVVLTGCDAYEEFPPTTPIATLFTPLFLPGVLELAAQAFRLRPVRRLFDLRPFTHRGVDDAVLVRSTAPLRDRRVRRDVRKAFAGMHARHTLRAAEANRTFPGPVLVAWGDDSRLFRRSSADRLVRDLPHARLEVLPDCAAFASLDQPERLARMVVEHLRRPAIA